MAFDGIVLANLIDEFNKTIVGGRIGKVNQPEKDELILTIRNNRTNYKLLLSSMASMPKVHLTEEAKKNPLTAPNFCMLLRKHLIGGEILSIDQPDFERIMIMTIEGLDELGDMSKKQLIIEIMGRHSNIILTDDQGMIIDAIRRVGAQISSVREVFPNRPYIAPPNKDKKNPMLPIDFEGFVDLVRGSENLSRGIMNSFTGISYPIAETICLRGGIHGGDRCEELSAEQMKGLYNSFQNIVNQVKSGAFEPTLYVESDDNLKDFSSLPLETYKNLTGHNMTSPSEMVELFYKKSANASRISQKSADLRKLVATNLERCYKKLALQEQQVRDTDDRDKYRIRGELINANLYQIKEGDPSVTLWDYYQNEEVTLTLDPTLSPAQNAVKQFEKYNKKKRTLTALTEQLETTRQEIRHLEDIRYALETALLEEDLTQIRFELIDAGYIRYRKSQKGQKALDKATPRHFLSSDGFHLYVGKNNYQNEFLVAKFAGGGDWWFHAKDLPGSHVIVKADGKDLTDKCYEEAAALAAYYSAGKDSPKVSVDYTLKKNLKKPPHSAPGYFIYHTNYSLMAFPSLEGLTLLEE